MFNSKEHITLNSLEHFFNGILSLLWNGINFDKGKVEEQQKKSFDIKGSNSTTKEMIENDQRTQIIDKIFSSKVINGFVVFINKASNSSKTELIGRSRVYLRFLLHINVLNTNTLMSFMDPFKQLHTQFSNIVFKHLILKDKYTEFCKILCQKCKQQDNMLQSLIS